MWSGGRSVFRSSLLSLSISLGEHVHRKLAFILKVKTKKKLSTIGLANVFREILAVSVIFEDAICWCLLSSTVAIVLILYVGIHHFF